MSKKANLRRPASEG